MPKGADCNKAYHDFPSDQPVFFLFIGESLQLIFRIVEQNANLSLSD